MLYEHPGQQEVAAHQRQAADEGNVSEPEQAASRNARPAAWFVIAPALMFSYGIVRLIDGRDGAYGPGLAWTIGHLLFLAGFVLFGAVVVRLRGLVPTTTWARKVTASVALVLAVAGIVAFVRVIMLDLVVGFWAADQSQMRAIRNEIGSLPGIVPEAVWDLGPVLFQVGLLTLTLQLAMLHPRRLATWSPLLILIGFGCIMLNLNLLPLGAALFGLALAPTAWRYPWNRNGSQTP